MILNSFLNKFIDLFSIVSDNYLYVLFFILLINIIVFIHEMGHYIVARYFKVGVDVFSIGMGPKLFGFYDKNNTLWQFCILPVGGYIAVKGEYNSEVKKESKGSRYDDQSPFVIFCISVAGPLINYISAFLVMSCVLFFKKPDLDFYKVLTMYKYKYHQDRSVKSFHNSIANITTCNQCNSKNKDDFLEKQIECKELLSDFNYNINDINKVQYVNDCKDLFCSMKNKKRLLSSDDFFVTSGVDFRKLSKFFDKHKNNKVFAKVKNKYNYTLKKHFVDCFKHGNFVINDMFVDDDKVFNRLNLFILTFGYANQFIECIMSKETFDAKYRELNKSIKSISEKYDGKVIHVTFFDEKDRFFIFYKDYVFCIKHGIAFFIADIIFDIIKKNYDKYFLSSDLKQNNLPLNIIMLNRTIKYFFLQEIHKFVDKAYNIKVTESEVKKTADKVDFHTTQRCLKRALKDSFIGVYCITKLSAISIKQVILNPKLISQFKGVVGMANYVNSDGLSIYNFLSKFVILSISIGFMNTLPLYGLDGGLAFIAIVEMITRKRISKKVLNITGYIVMVFLLGIMLYVNLNEVIQIIYKFIY